MKIWKVIFATFVIFAAGAFAGGMFVKFTTPPATTVKAPVSPVISQQHFQDRMKRELKLTADQTNRMDKIFAESNARRTILVNLIEPELRKERQEVYESIRGVLTVEQQATFEKLLKEPPRRPDGFRRGRGTNQTNSAKMPEPSPPQ